MQDWKVAAALCVDGDLHLICDLRECLKFFSMLQQVITKGWECHT